MEKVKDFAGYLTDYFMRYLPEQAGASQNTIKAYRDTFIVFMRYYNDVWNIRPEKLSFSSISRERVEEFLLWLETTRGCSISSRNHRLASIHSFFRYLMWESPGHLELCSRILGIRMKRKVEKPVEYLTLEAVKELFAVVDTADKKGRRDLAILVLLYDTGARVSELTDIKVGSIRFRKPAVVTLTGKGNKSRTIPIMPQTMDVIKKYMDDYGIHETDYNCPLFFNKRQDPLSREGIAFILKKHVETARTKHPDLFDINVTPHTLRHGKAMALVESNVNLIYIRDFLGHSSVTTTEIYAKANPELKRKAIEGAGRDVVPEGTYTEKEKEDMINWLKRMI